MVFWSLADHSLGALPEQIHLAQACTILYSCSLSTSTLASSKKSTQRSIPQLWLVMTEVQVMRVVLSSIVVVISKHILEPLVNSPGQLTFPQVSKAFRTQVVLGRAASSCFFLDLMEKRGSWCWVSRKGGYKQIPTAC